ncbi:integrin alpha-2-like [Salmo trutta]|uniref:integrin alpha-2-like n=1 Tax=Salmo trutta TaxID=8032 RepID=UPI001131359F|nr:integrin alpha-2-like [Salmo trutta]
MNSDTNWEPDVHTVWYSEAFNVGTADAKVFSGPANEQFGYTVQQLTNHQGKWLLVGAPWSGFTDNRKGDVYKCPVSGSKTSCDKLNIQDSINIPDERNINVNMSLGLTLTRMPKISGFMTCGPLWAQRCGSQDFCPGVCAGVSPLFKPHSAFSPAVQTCGGPMDIVIVLDGSNSIYPWTPINEFLKKLLPTLDIGPQSTQVSVIQYAVSAQFEFKLNTFKTKEGVLSAASGITQMYGAATNTFHAIQYASRWGFHQDNGGRPGAAKVMVVVTDGESHDEAFRDTVIRECEKENIRRFGIAVLGYYIRNNIDTKNLIAEIKSIASLPTENYFFNVSEEATLSSIAEALGDRIFNIEGTGKGGEDFQMQMSQVGFSAHYSSKMDVMMLGAVGAYAWSGTVVHQRGGQRADIFPLSAFERTLQDRNHSSLLGYSVTTLSDGQTEYFVAGAPRSNHSGQVIVYTVTSSKQVTVIDSEREKQIGSYFGSVLCPLDVDKDGTSDVLLVGAPMFMNDLKKEQGRVYLFSVTKGILSEQGFLVGLSPGENARFGTAISAVPDLDQDGFCDVVVGAPLEDSGRGVVYVYNGDKKTLHKQHSQRILGSKFDFMMQYFGRSLDGYGDMNDDTIPDISVGAHGKVIQLWSRGLAAVTAKASFSPDKINILSKPCLINGQKLSCFKTDICFSATFRPKKPVGPLTVKYNLTLDADLQSSRVSSRGLFSQNRERLLSGNVQISSSTTSVCHNYQVYVQESADFVNSISLRVDIGLQNPDANPVLDVFSQTAWDFSIPFSKQCGSDDVCVSDLVLSVKKVTEVPSVGSVLVSSNNREISFEVLVKNIKENAYNTQILVTYSKSLFYASITSPSDGKEVKCTSTTQSDVLACQVGYPALEKDEEVKFWFNFDFNLNHLQSQARVHFQAKSAGKEESPADNTVDITIPVRYDAEIIMTRESNINFYVVDEAKEVQTSVKTLDDIGPEFNFSLKISTGNFPVRLLYLTISVPVTTRGGNPLIYVTGLDTPTGDSVSCDSALVDPLKIGSKPHTALFSKESLRGIHRLDCWNVKCQAIKCVIKDMRVKSVYFVNVTTRIWNGTLASATFQTIELITNTEIVTSQPDLLIITHKTMPVGVTVSKPGETADVPVGVIVGSVIGGLLLLALVVGLLWKFGFFKRKYQQLRERTEYSEEPQENGP